MQERFSEYMACARKRRGSFRLSSNPTLMQAAMPKLGRTQKTLIILLLTIPELVALVPLALHYLHPSHAARDPKPSVASTPAAPGRSAPR